MASMNRGLNLPQIQRIMTDFEKESSMMDMKEEMMSDAVDDVMDEEEDEEEEGDKILKQVLDEIGVDLSHQVRLSTDSPLFFISIFLQLTEAPTGIAAASKSLADRQPVALGEQGGASPAGPSNTGGGAGPAMSDEDALQARLDALRRG